jgi:membrane protein DedA with SNARE-associated domain
LFEHYAHYVPLEQFVFIGTLIEELISPIPSLAVLLPAGAAASVQGRGLAYLLVLVVISAVGRIIAAVILYWLADKFEGTLLAKGRRFFGVSHRQVAQLSRRLERSSYRAWVSLFLMNALPVFPAGALSVCCGFVKVPFAMFVTTTFFGSMISAGCYLFAGYSGLKAVATLQHVELVSQIAAGLIAVVATGWWLWLWLLKRRRMRLS